MTVPASTAAALIAKAAAFDNRTVTEVAAAAWAEALDDYVTLADGAAAVSAHYAETRDWIMPSNINARVRKIRRNRADVAPTPPAPPVLLDTAEDIAWRRHWLDAITAGATPEQAETVANEAHGIDTATISPRTTRQIGNLL